MLCTSFFRHQERYSLLRPVGPWMRRGERVIHSWRSGGSDLPFYPSIQRSNGPQWIPLSKTRKTLYPTPIELWEVLHSHLCIMVVNRLTSSCSGREPHIVVKRNTRLEEDQFNECLENGEVVEVASVERALEGGGLGWACCYSHLASLCAPGHFAQGLRVCYFL
jgi:hypothetical protein